MSKTSLPLSGRVALITGSGRGLGRTCALALADQGAAIIVNDILPEPCQNTSSEIIERGGEAIACVADVSDQGQVQAMVAAAIKWKSKVDILVNNAGFTVVHPIEDIELDEWNRILAINLTGMFLCCKAVLPTMRAQQWGRVINISSIAGQRGALFGDVHYAATKAGQVGFSKTLARTVAKEGITVNCVAPGPIDTELLGMNIIGERRKQAMAEIPRGQFGSHQEFAETVLFLCGEHAGHITGATININGGAYMQ